MNRDFKGIWIPKEIWLHKNLSLQSKALWAEIWSLHDPEFGGCYASNEYLCDFMGMKVSRLKETLKELRDNDLLEDVHFDGRRRVIQAVVPEVENGGILPAGKPASTQPENRLSSSRDPGYPSYYIDTRLVKRNSDGEKPKIDKKIVAVFSSLKKIPDDKISEKDKIAITKKFTEEQVQKALKFVKYAEDAGIIKTSFIKTFVWACKEQPEVPKGSKENIEENKEFSKNIPEQTVSYRKLERCPKGMMIISEGEGKIPEFFDYADPRFKEKLLKKLETYKMKLE